MPSIINYVFLVYILLKPVFVLFPFNFDGAGRLQFLGALIVLCFNITRISFQKVLKSKPVILWGIWGLYTTVNLLIKGISSDTSFFIFWSNSIFVVWVVFLVAIYESMLDFSRLARTLIISISIYVSIGIIFQDSAQNLVERGEFILGNEMSLNAVALCCLSVFSYTQKIIKKKSLIFVFVISIIAILMVATRKAFGAIFIYIFLFLLYKYPLRNPKNLIKIFFILFFLFLFSKLLLDNSLLGERLSADSIEEDAQKYNEDNIPFLNLLGDRAYFYITGWKLFLANPVSGIGIFNYRYTDPVGIPIHSEYIVQLAENGLVGTLLFFYFYFTIVSFISKARSDHKIFNESILIYGWILVLAFISLTAWIYDSKYFFAVTGFLLGYLYYKNSYLYKK